VIRKLQADEVRQVVNKLMSCGYAAEELAALPFPLSPETAAEAFEFGIRAGKAVAFVIEGGRGILVGVFGTEWLTGALCGYVYWWAVEPNFRGSFASVRLLREFEKECKARGCAVVVSGNVITSAEQMRRLHLRLGYKPHSESYFKKL
jgi:GNAT superfamily N-acetyltransferase